MEKAAVVWPLGKLSRVPVSGRGTRVIRFNPSVRSKLVPKASMVRKPWTYA